MTNLVQPMTSTLPTAPVYVSSLSQIPAGAVPVNLPAQSTTQATPLQSMLAWTTVGVAAGAGIGLLPFLPLTLLSGALIGAGLGATIGLAKNLGTRQPVGQYAMTPGVMLPATATATPATATPANASGSTPAPAPARTGVVMSPAMRHKWALKVAAERAATAGTTGTTK